MARVTKEERNRLADVLTETEWDYDPYNGLFRDELLDINKRDLRTIEGCHAIIEGLCDMLRESMETVGELLREAK